MARDEFTTESAFQDSGSTIRLSIERFNDRLLTMPPAEAEMVVEAATRALRQDEEPSPSVITALTGSRAASPAERVKMEIDVLMQSFARRRELLADTMTASEVAKLLGTSRQTPHDRIASGTLIAVKDRGAWRFPIWQFDPEGEEGVVQGLPAVIQALDVSAIARVSWLTRANPMLDGATPIECLKRGRTDEVVELARGVGVD